MSTRTKKLTRCAFAAAYGVIALLLGSVIPVLDATMLCFASFGVIFALMSCGDGWAVLTYAATALLCWMLLPEKTLALAYTALTGLYPIVKLRAERKAKRPVRIGIKLAFCNAVLALWYTLGAKLLGVEGELAYPLLILIPVANAAFFIYDYALTQLILFYIRKIARRIH